MKSASVQTRFQLLRALAVAQLALGCSRTAPRERNPELTAPAVATGAPLVLSTGTAASAASSGMPSADKPSADAPSPGAPSADAKGASSGTATEDERKVREELQIPADALLVALSSEPETAGFFGREGLRIVAEFKLSAESTARYHAQVNGTAGWSTAPLPPQVQRFSAPPLELKSVTGNLVYCRAGVWRSGLEFDPYPCETKRKIDHYRTAVLDLNSGKLTVVFKNYY